MVAWLSFMNGSFPKLGVPLWGAPVVRTVVHWDLYWDPPVVAQFRVDSVFAGSLMPLTWMLRSHYTSPQIL